MRIIFYLFRNLAKKILNIKTKIDEIKTKIDELNSRAYITEFPANANNMRYVRFSNGLQIVWGFSNDGSISNGAKYSDHTHNLPAPFINGYYAITFGGWTNTVYTQNVPVPVVIDQLKGSFKVRVWRNVEITSNGASPFYMWVAIGAWK